MSATGQADVLKRAIVEVKQLREKLRQAELRVSEPIAVVGIGCRLPGGVHDAEALWALVRDGREGIREPPPGRWDVPAFYDPDPDAPGKTHARAGGFLDDDVSAFDAELFGISPSEAVAMDPQQRLLLEVAWEALEDAGQPPTALEGSRTGVFIGIIGQDYSQLQSLHGAGPEEASVYAVTGNLASVAAGRISFALGLQGPSIALDTACSSSLVAMHLACTSLRRRETDLALAGGVMLVLSPIGNIGLSKMRAVAPDGRCKTFDASADGYGRGEGCGILALERLSTAQERGRRIHALVRGTAVNQDGPSSGLTVPNGPAQQAVIRQALEDAGVAPHTVGYIEAHGTGTPLGDPIEIQAITAVFGKDPQRTEPLRLGSAKANLAHLEAAAGVAGVIKTIVSMTHQQLPPLPSLRQLNPRIELGAIPAKIPTMAEPWPEIEGTRRAGVSSFGFSGTNAHVLLEQAPRVTPDEAPSASEDRPAHLLCVSARSAAALSRLAERYALALDDAASWGAFCHQANTGRAQHAHRLTVRAADAAAGRRTLDAFVAGSVEEGVGTAVAGRPQKVAFLFTGQGSQFPGMGRALYDTQPVYRAAIDRCAAVLDGLLERPLLELLHSADDDPALHRTANTQPALFALEYALACLWKSWGVVPGAVMGHSVGEYVAATVSGALSLEDGLALIAERGRLMQALPEGGAMAALFLPEAQVEPLVAGQGGRVSIAGINGPEEVVISGEAEAVEAIVAEVESRGVETRRLKVSHAFHSHLLDPMLDALETRVAQVTFGAAEIRVISNVTGQPLKAAELADPKYWRTHSRAAVRFADGIQTLYERGYRVFIELGPRPILLGLGARCLPDADDVRWITSLRRNASDWDTILDAAGAAWRAGVELDWRGFDQHHRFPWVDLPTYPFERTRYWFDVERLQRRRRRSSGTPTGIPLLGERLDAPLPTFSAQLDPDQLADAVGRQQLFGAASLPPAAVLSWMRAAARALGRPDAALIDLAGVSALPLPEPGEPLEVQVVCPAEDAVQVHVRDAFGSWRCVGAARLGAAVPGAAPAADGVDVDVAELIDGLGARGLITPKGAIEGLRARTGQATGRLARGLPEAVALTAAAACLHAALGPRTVELPTNAAELPEGFEKVLELAMAASLPIYDLEGAERVLGTPTGTRVHVEIREDTRDRVVADLTFVEEGRVAGQLAGARYRPRDRRTFRAARVHDPSGWLQALAWRPVAHAGSPEPRPFVLLPDRGGVAEALAERLRAAGVEVTLADAPSGACCVDLRPLDVTTPDRAEDAQDTVLASVGSALTASRAATASGTRMWWVTRGAQHGVTEPAQAPIWAFGRVLSLEHPECWGGLIDLDPAAADLDALVAELMAPDGDHVAFRGGERFVARLIRAELPSGQPTFRGVHLITGGLGGIGLELARWVAAHGAERVVLTSRRAAPPEMAPDLSAQLGVPVEVAQVDVVDRDGMTALVGRLAADPAGLRGVYHAAGLTIPRLVDGLEDDVLARVLAPKVAGGWLLHELTRGLDLDQFVCFSSISATWGSVGLANYAAANHFLDALVAHRRAAGLPGAAVAWGPWGEVGMSSSVEEQVLMERMGIRALPTRPALEALGRAVASGTAAVTVADMDWALFKPLYEVRLARPLLAELDTDGDAGTGDASLLAELIGGRRDDLPARLGRYLKGAIARGLHVEPDSIADATHIAELGMDSLMVMEVLNGCKRDLAVQLYPRDVFEHPSIGELVGYLAQEFARTHLGETPVEEVEPARDEAFLPDLFPHLKPYPPLEKRNPPAVFLLSSPRSGSTLLRVMLEGHPRLFCPPELHLLPFVQMAERKEEVAASYMGEGLTRAIMALVGSPEEATELVERWEREARPVHEVYGELQERLGDRLLVDKSPSYAGSAGVLRRAEELFEAPLYIHLVRHPYAVVESIVRNRIDRLFGVVKGDPHFFGEQMWASLNKNIADHLATVDPGRRLLVIYEDLVSDPEREMRRMCEFLGLPFDPAVLEPYRGKRMTDGVHEQSLSIGDPNFLQHRSIERSLGEAWRRIDLPRDLTPSSQRMAEAYGYPVPAEARRARVADAELPRERVAQLAADQLARHPGAAPIRDWLRARGVRTPAWERFGIGWIADADAIRREVPGADLDGLAGRVLFPARAADKTLAGWLARDPETGDDRWVGDGEPTDHVFGVAEQRGELTVEDHAIVAEDVIDVLRAVSLGFRNLVTGLQRGVTLTLAQLEAIRPATDVVVGFEPLGWTRQDGDGALQNSSGRVDVPVAHDHRFVGSFSYRAFHSEVLGRDVEYAALIPAATTGPVPLLVFLQGAERTAIDRLGILLDRMMSAGAIQPMAVVFAAGGRSLYLNKHDGTERWEDHFLDELIPSRIDGLEVSIARDKVGLIGVSMGALGALRMAFRRPAMFAAVMAHMPAMEAGLTWKDVPRDSLLAFLRPAAFQESLYGRPVDGDGHWTRNNPSWLAHDRADGIRTAGLAIHLDVGSEDAMARDGAVFLHAQLEALDIAHSFRLVQDGRHNRGFASVAVIEGVQFFSRHVAAVEG